MKDPVRYTPYFLTKGTGDSATHMALALVTFCRAARRFSVLIYTDILVHDVIEVAIVIYCTCHTTHR